MVFTLHPCDLQSLNIDLDNKDGDQYPFHNILILINWLTFNWY